jgi:hypothetical protein
VSDLWAEIRTTAEEIIELRRDVEYAGGVGLAQMILSLSEVDDEEFAGLLMEGVHTGLRKGSDAPLSGVLWHAISESVFSEDSSWGDACRYAVYGLKSMGYKLVKEPS